MGNQARWSADAGYTATFIGWTDEPILSITTQRKEFYHLRDPGYSDRCDEDPAWLRELEAMETIICPECMMPYPEAGPLDVHLQGRLPEVPLANLGGVDIGIVHRSFVDQMGRQLFTELFYLGRVFEAKRGELTQFQSFIGRKGQFFVRGGPISKEHDHCCGTCGRPLYLALGEEHHMHLFQAKLPADPISHSNWNGLIVDGEIYRAIDWSLWKKNPYVVKLPILDKPLDGIDEVF